MKLSASELALLRAYPQASKVYLGVERGVTLLTARADGNHAEGDTTIQLTGVVLPTGDADDLVRGMTVALASVASNDRRVDAAFLSYDSGTEILTISANARQVDDGFYVTVYSSMKLWKVPPDPDWDAPFAIMGPPRMGFAGEPLAFMGANSYSPLGRTLTAYQWRKYDAALVSGSLSIPNTAANPLVLVWNTAGEYLVRLKVTDDEGKTGIRYCPVLIFDRAGLNAPYTDVIVRNCAYSGRGWSAGFQVYAEAADNDTFPPQALVLLSTLGEDYYGGVKQSVGGCYRGASDMLFAGWIQAESVNVDAEEKSVSFVADSIEQWMDRLTMPNATLRQTDTDFNLLTFNSAYAVLDRLRHTTLAAIADVFLALFDYQLEIVDLTQGSLLTQITQSLIGKYGYVAGSRFGSVTIARDKNLLTAAMRAGLKDSALLFTPEDWLDLTIDKERFASVAQWHIEGKDGEDTPIAADYPVSGPGHNGAVLEDTGWIFLDQAQADELVELYTSATTVASSTFKFARTITARSNPRSRTRSR